MTVKDVVAIHNAPCATHAKVLHNTVTKAIASRPEKDVKRLSNFPAGPTACDDSIRLNNRPDRS